MLRFVRRAAAGVAVTVGLLVTMTVPVGAAEPAQQAAQQAAQPDSARALPCDYLPPPAEYYYDSTHSTCSRCLDAARALEQSGNWRAYCRNVAPDPAGRADLYKFCVVCFQQGEEARWSRVTGGW